MLPLKEILIEKSLATKKLHYKKSWTFYLEAIIYLYSVIFGFIICPYFIYQYELNWSNINEQFIGYYILPLTVFYGIYMSIRTFTQLRLKKIETKFDYEYNFKSILKFANKEGYVVRRKNNNCIVLDQYKMYDKHARTAVLILRNGEIFFTYLQDNYKLNTPTFMSHLFFAWRLKKWFKKKDACNTQ